ncbi:MAG: cohesin domain-containing protein [Acutalibacteraceae bacterium]
MKQRIRSWIAAFMLTVLAALLCHVGAFAAEGGAIAVGSAQANAGERVTVPLNMDKNPGIFGMALVVNYDPTVLTFDSVSYGDVFREGEFILTHRSGQVRISVFNTKIADNINTGKLMDLTFRVSKTAVGGQYAVSVAAVDETATQANGAAFRTDGRPMNVDSKYVDFTYSSGTVTVAGGAAPSGSAAGGADSGSAEGNASGGGSDSLSGSSSEGGSTYETQTDKNGNVITPEGGAAGGEPNRAGGSRARYLWLIIAAVIALAAAAAIVYRRRAAAKSGADCANSLQSDQQSEEHRKG